MKIRHYNRQTSKYEEYSLTFWREGKDWKCAVPRPKDHWIEQCGRHWKKYGLIGRGKTRDKALEDWKISKDASDFVAAIY
jgi:hypothetical protein